MSDESISETSLPMFLPRFGFWIKPEVALLIDISPYDHAARI